MGNDASEKSFSQMSNYVLRLAQSHNNISLNMNHQILEPFDIFIKNFKGNNGKIVGQAK